MNENKVKDIKVMSVYKVQRDSKDKQGRPAVVLEYSNDSNKVLIWAGTSKTKSQELEEPAKMKFNKKTTYFYSKHIAKIKPEHLIQNWNKENDPDKPAVALNTCQRKALNKTNWKVIGNLLTEVENRENDKKENKQLKNEIKQKNQKIKKLEAEKNNKELNRQIKNLTNTLNQEKNNKTNNQRKIKDLEEQLKEKNNYDLDDQLKEKNNNYNNDIKKIASEEKQVQKTENKQDQAYENE